MKKAAQAYIIALGVNDLLGLKQELGSVQDIFCNNADSDGTKRKTILCRKLTVEQERQNF